MLVGREAECRELRRLLRAAADGTSGSLLIRGDPGTGKTALLDFAARQARGFLIASAKGVESESEIAFGALVGLCRPMLGHLDRLSGRQRTALETAIAISVGSVPDRFTAFAAFLSLLGATAEDRPVLVLVDDLQWLDRSSAEAVLFAARRLGPDRVAVLLGSRLHEKEGVEVGDIGEVRLGGLGDAAGVQLLQAGHPDKAIPHPVASKLVQLTGGLPLALLEIPRLLSFEQLRGEEALPEPLPVGEAVQQAYRQEISALPSGCTEALLLLAADDTGSLDAVGWALEARGSTTRELDLAEHKDLIKVRNGRGEFRHPLLRSLIYHSGSAHQRRHAHIDLARAYEGHDRARYIWHRAAAAERPDESVAAGLEEWAADTRARGAHASATLALERAAELTPDPDIRARRRFEAGTAAWVGGQTERALRNLDAALDMTQDPLLRADVQEARGRLLFTGGSMLEAYALLVDEAMRIERVAPEKAVAMLLEACSVSSGAAYPARGLEAAMLATTIAGRVGGTAELLAGLALAQPLILTGRTREGLRLLKKLQPMASSHFRAPLSVPFDPVIGVIYSYVDRAFSRRLLDMFHEASRVNAPHMLPQALAHLSFVEIRMGEWQLAVAHATEGAELGGVIGQDGIKAFALALLATVYAGMGREESRGLAHESMQLADRTGSRSIIVFGHHVSGLLDLGLGHMDDAVAALEESGRLMREWGVRDLQVVPWLPDLIEAHVRAGHEARAQELVAELVARAKASGDTWSKAVASRCSGLMDRDFEEHFSRALHLHEAMPSPFDRARTELAFAERLRRSGRRREARPHLYAAFEAFDRLGAMPWKARTEAELGSTGPHVGSKREPVERLSPQELQVALVVGAGATNREAAAALFVTAKTVEYHLSNVYRKLGIRSRSELARLIATQGVAERSPTATA